MIDGVPTLDDIAVERALSAATDLLVADWVTALLLEEPSQPSSTATVLRAERSSANHQVERFQGIVTLSSPLSWITGHGAVFADDSPSRALLPAAVGMPGVLASLVVALPPRGNDPEAVDIAGSGALLVERIEGRPFLAGDVERANRMAARLVAVIDRVDRRRRELDGNGDGAPIHARRSEAARDRLSAALEASGTILVTYSLDGAITSVDGNATALLGLDTPEIVGRSLLDFIPADECGAARDRLETRTDGDFSQRRFETRVLHRDGRAIPVLMVAGPQFEGRRHVGHAVAMTDLTDLMSLQRERTAALAARSLAEGAVHTGRAIAHKLGSPVSSILVLAELMVGDFRLPPQSKADMQLLFDEAVRAGALLHRFSRIPRYEDLDTVAGPQLYGERPGVDERPNGAAV